MKKKLYLCILIFSLGCRAIIAEPENTQQEVPSDEDLSYWDKFVSWYEEKHTEYPVVAAIIEFTILATAARYALIWYKNNQIPTVSQSNPPGQPTVGPSGQPIIGLNGATSSSLGNLPKSDGNPAISSLSPRRGEGPFATSSAPANSTPAAQVVVSAPEPSPVPASPLTQNNGSTGVTAPSGRVPQDDSANNSAIISPVDVSAQTTAPLASTPLSPGTSRAQENIPGRTSGQTITSDNHPSNNDVTSSASSTSSESSRSSVVTIRAATPDTSTEGNLQLKHDSVAVSSNTSPDEHGGQTIPSDAPAEISNATVPSSPSSAVIPTSGKSSTSAASSSEPTAVYMTVNSKGNPVIDSFTGVPIDDIYLSTRERTREPRPPFKPAELFAAVPSISESQSPSNSPKAQSLEEGEAKFKADSTPAYFQQPPISGVVDPSTLTPNDNTTPLSGDEAWKEVTRARTGDVVAKANGVTDSGKAAAFNEAFLNAKKQVASADTGIATKANAPSVKVTESSGNPKGRQDAGGSNILNTSDPDIPSSPSMKLVPLSKNKPTSPKKQHPSSKVTLSQSDPAQPSSSNSSSNVPPTVSTSAQPGSNVAALAGRVGAVLFQPKRGTPGSPYRPPTYPQASDASNSKS